MHHLYHNSFDSLYRSPFGAVATGESITLRLTIEHATNVEAVYAALYYDKEQREERLPLVLESVEHDKTIYVLTFLAPAEPQLLWYSFAVLHDGLTTYYGKGVHGYGGVGVSYVHPAPKYQITVYERGSMTPAWFKETVMYQIFVDRFYNGDPDRVVRHAKKNSLLHAHWDNTPVYIKNERGDVIRWDFFGGNLEGVRQKLSYLYDLGIRVLYLNPIFEASSNHKYDVGDYHRIDAMFGDNELFARLCAEAKEYGIAIILDGVFSHTGNDSLYFNQYDHYASVGAYQSTDSPYYDWYRFTAHPDAYDCWWGVKALPNVNELVPSYLDFVIHAPNSVVNHWHQHGIKGWRLDVADELPPSFLQQFKARLRALDPDAILIGEVWEDASNKVSYDIRREYLLGRELDSVMNYPFRAIVLDFLLGKTDARTTHVALMTLYENYPTHHFYSMMNVLGSHDVPRLLTALADHLPSSWGEEKRAVMARARAKAAIVWQMTFPGVPSVYYGDEAGVTGGTDPYNRATYPWGKEDEELLEWTKRWIHLRHTYDALRTGEWESGYVADDVYYYVRTIRGGVDRFGTPQQDNAILVILNRSLTDTLSIRLPLHQWFTVQIVDAMNGQAIEVLQRVEGQEIELLPLCSRVFVQRVL